MELVSCCESSWGRLGRNEWFIHKEVVQFSSRHHLCFIYLEITWRQLLIIHACTLSETTETHTNTLTPPQHLAGASHFVHRKRHHPLRGAHSVKSAFKTQSHRGTHMFAAAENENDFFFFFFVIKLWSVCECPAWILHQVWAHMGNLPGRA